MQHTDVLNRIRRVVGLPLLVSSVGGCGSSQVLSPEPTPITVMWKKEGMLHATYPTLIGADTDPVATFLSYPERHSTVEQCLSAFPNCLDLCDLSQLVAIHDDAQVDKHTLTINRTQFQPVGSPPSCDGAKWTWKREYFVAPEGWTNSYVPNGGLMYEAVGDATTGAVQSFEEVGIRRMIPGRPFHDRVAPCSTASTNRWLRAAQFEHASVASFAQHLLEMMSLGAPLDLLQAITAAQQDEVVHTQLCLQRAAQDGVQATLGPLNIHVPQRRSVYDITRGVALDGCVNETLSVMQVIDDMSTATPADAELLRIIANDEARHAELAWTSLMWLWPQLSTDEQHALRREMRHAIPSRFRHALRPAVAALAA